VRIVASVVLMMTCACKDYPYRHEIAGKVVDSAGAPMASVSVQRVDDKNKSYGVDELYKRVTNDKGEFSFVNEGRGPSPLPSAPWRLQVDFGGGTTQVYPVNAPWRDGASGCAGYCAKALVLSR
jgi:hypothetical protein